MLHYSDYTNVIFDFDGVILDSNPIKRACIEKASRAAMDEEAHQAFVRYFTDNNGVPRGVKIARYFEGARKEEVLKEYERCLHDRLLGAKVTDGVRLFLDVLRYHGIAMFVLSGGDEDEVKTLLDHHGLRHYFSAVKGGPRLKADNLEALGLQGKTLFIGDSRSDYLVAEGGQLDFVFMYGHTQFLEWKVYFKDKADVLSIRDLRTLVNCGC